MYKQIHALQKWLLDNEDDDRDASKANEVIPGLYISGLHGYANHTAYHIDVIISLSQIPAPPSSLIEHHKFQLRDEESAEEKKKLQDILPRAFHIIDRAIRRGRRVLVHCAEGRSRSAAVVMYYLMRGTKSTLSDAAHHLSSVRNICPNAGFLEVLWNAESNGYA